MRLRTLTNDEKDLLKDFLYEVIFIPEGLEPPAREIIYQPELKISGNIKFSIEGSSGSGISSCL